MSEIKVNSIKGVSASSAAITINNTDGTCTANITNNLSNRNLVINGAMQVAQRGTSNTAGGAGYFTVDRIYYYNQGIDNDVTKAQADVASGTTPYSLGFRKSFKLTNGDQSGGVGTNDMIVFDYKLEAQDIANSGWNYTSSSSDITLSFWVKSSVAQNFYVRLLTNDGTAQNYTFETGSLTADTWTKITKTIEGNSNLQFNNDNGVGLDIEWSLFRGTDSTGSMSLNAWAADNTSIRTPDQTSTWYTTNDATFEITGVQLEVDHTGSGVATDFEHRSYADELRRCQRYYYVLANGNQQALGDGLFWSASEISFITRFPVEMRASPDFDQSYGTDYFKAEGGGYGDGISSYWRSQYKSTRGTNHWLPADTNGTTGLSITIFSNNASAKLAYSAEL